jgi:hypothetical protein
VRLLYKIRMIFQIKIQSSPSIFPFDTNIIYIYIILFIVYMYVYFLIVTHTFQDLY